MFALQQRKKEWEHYNQRVLVRLVQTSTNVSVESVKAAGLLTSFLIYLIYKTMKGMLALGAFMVCGSQMIRKVAPGKRPLEYYEFNRHTLEQIRTPHSWR